MNTHVRTLFCTIVLFLFTFPAFAYAANPPALTTYTISHDTIYPTATVESGLATTTSIDIAFSGQVKTSIKIMSASGVMMKSLYSSQSVTNPASKIWDGMNSKGTRVDDGVYTILISATSTADRSLSVIDSSRTITVAHPLVSGVQLSAANDSSNVIQAVRLDDVSARQVEPIISTRTTVQEHADAVNAPAAATELAAAGAAVSPNVNSSLADASSTTSNSTTHSLFKSPWTFGLLGVMVLAGGAFILL